MEGRGSGSTSVSLGLFDGESIHLIEIEGEPVFVDRVAQVCNFLAGFLNAGHEVAVLRQQCVEYSSARDFLSTKN